MNNEYWIRSNCLEKVTIENLMKARLDKMVVIRMESRREKTIREI